MRQPVLTALFGCFNRDLLPFRLFLRGAFGIDLNNRAVGNDRRDFGCANLDCLLDAAARSREGAVRRY